LAFGLVALNHAEGGQGRPRPEFVGTLVILLDRQSLVAGLFPALAVRYFGAPEDSIYDVAIMDRRDRDRAELVYSSREPLTAASFAGAEVELPLLWGREEVQEGGRFRGPGRGGPDGRPPGGEFDLSGMMFDSLAPAGPGGDWVVAVNAAGGSLDAVVGRLRRRNLGISMGVLALLAAGMGVLLVSTRRAERLARLQMEFVAGVSHELRTPLAVIRSAGDNLAEGVVQAPSQVKEYGKLIRDEGRRLTGMVEQTLQFASTQAGRQPYKVESAGAEEFLRRAIDDLRPAVEEAGFLLEEQFEAGLPEVRIDVAAGSRILQSLVENALKYGGESKWVGIEAASRNGAVDVTVRDRGVGIDAEDLPHIFDPFYRGKRATDAQIHGTGLGLALARSAAEGFGGRLRAESEPGQGSAFTLSIPKAEAS
jgi:signal transduction histidine kinase